MRKIILMTSAAVIAPMSAIAQTPTCTATPDCASLGYTESSCANGGVKCPWGDTWFCATSEAETCSKYGFKYTCTGRGYSGTAGQACNGKYTSCKCADEFEWRDEQGCVDIDDCRIGSIFYSDKSCSLILDPQKKPIGVVVYSYGKGHGQAMSLASLYTTWGGYGLDISDLPRHTSESDASEDFASCANSAQIMAAGDSSTYPAAWAAHGYKTEGTNVGDWCLPAPGIFTSIYNNQSVINTGFSRAGGAQLTSDMRIWASSVESMGYAWTSYFQEGSYGVHRYRKDSYIYARPVIEF